MIAWWELGWMLICDWVWVCLIYREDAEQWKVNIGCVAQKLSTSNSLWVHNHSWSDPAFPNPITGLILLELFCAGIMPTNFIGLFLVLLLLLFCKVWHRNVLRSCASLATEWVFFILTSHILVCTFSIVIAIVFVLTPQRQGCCVSPFLPWCYHPCSIIPVKVSILNLSLYNSHPLNSSFNLNRWIQKSCKSNISHSWHKKDSRSCKL